MTPEQERKAIRRAQRDPQAFVHLYDHYFPRIHAYVRYRVANPEDAQDVVADVFFRAIRELKRFQWRSRGSFAAWLFRIAHNRIVDHYRASERAALSQAANNALAKLTSDSPSPEEALTQQETFQQVRDLIITLSPRRQEIITLRFFAGLRNNEIAQVLGLDQRTVAAHLSRGLRDLERRYTEQTQTGVVTEVGT
jgi:RNA polymerase sigma-70 factor (ECF subfamily)